ncbi:TetR/AcrR family transcriptional regulator [Candidatus Acetothermia bacterium]|jgi:AcrR family transcriptional regulator|nr:TetR/AcrR family transcriptional regulator [Candidatus Acetothermia bacterium]MCI2427543.1 TetR/AcrR family transcriptional regulator [Candidatus Acetothermia bacterium]MCI2428112.1 TetR/AcrR family transcriptional regulator [Candidatus Acetothermia bacterium]
MEQAIPKRKKWIIEAAVAAFAQKGFHLTSMREIAKSAAVAIGTLYHYFDSKEEMLNDILRAEIDVLQRALAEITQSNRSAKEQIDAVLQLCFARLAKDKSLTKLIFCEKVIAHDKFRDNFRSLQDTIISHLQKIITRGIAKGEIARCNPSLVAALIMGAITVMVGKIVDTEESSEGINQHEVAQQLHNLLWQGLTTKLNPAFT